MADQPAQAMFTTGSFPFAENGRRIDDYRVQLVRFATSGSTLFVPIRDYPTLPRSVPDKC